jgi:hypothetical protein
LKSANDQFEQDARIADTQRTAGIFPQGRRFGLNGKSHGAVLLI